MKVYNPTQYGSVEVQETAGTTQLDSQTQGTILKLVAQPFNDSYPQVDSSGKWTFVEKYIGPTTVVRDLPYHAFTIGRTRTSARLAAGGTSIFEDRFGAPRLPDGYADWVVESVTVRQKAAGDMSEISIRYKGSTYSPSSSWQDNPLENTWSLQWQTYTLTPYAFAKNSMQPDKQASETPSITDTASRTNIEMFLNPQNGVNNKVDISGYVYLDDQYISRRLNPAEQLIVKKLTENKNCQWHYPIITHNTSKSANLSALSVIIPPIFPNEVGGVDFTYQTDAPALSGMPFHFMDNAWEWVKIDDSVEGHVEGGNFVYKRSEKFMGVISADVNFYGTIPFSHNNLSACRWIPSGL